MERGHDRIERRTICTAEADDTLFPSALHDFRLRRDVGDVDGAWTSKEIVSGITRMPTSLAGPTQFNH
ncbi:hypothetical protein ACSDR0_49125 [Streptosporangium sp. G11]|uniref:hypothetical protein n=1 Tax=Streptosporangium sp. G11 TaxID=3436926 RepID=UPI003EC06931